MALQRAKREFTAAWDESGDCALSYAKTEAIGFSLPTFPVDPGAALELLAALSIEQAELGPLYDEWVKRDLPSVGNSDRHATHGRGCSFKGLGHDRLVSWRWLDFGPWRVRRGPGDLETR